MDYQRIVTFCAEECQRQNSGELSVADMFNAYTLIMTPEFEIDESTILTLGMRVDWKSNMNGFRSVPVSFANGSVIGADNILHQITNLVKFQDEISAPEFYQEFESIHPFVDGNGRVGAILYNYKNGSILNPVTPPEYVTD